MKPFRSLTQNRDFRALYAKGKSAAGSAVVLYCKRQWVKRRKPMDNGGGRCSASKNPRVPRLDRQLSTVNGRLPAPRFGITATTKLGNAVVRNRIRRRIREALRLELHRFSPGNDVVIVARSNAAAIPFALLRKEIVRLGKKSGAIPDPNAPHPPPKRQHTPPHSKPS